MRQEITVAVVVAFVLIFSFYVKTNLDDLKQFKADIAQTTTSFRSPAPVGSSSYAPAVTLAPVSSPIYEYRVVSNVDPCSLNRLGKDSWHLVQSGNYVNTFGYKVDCKTQGSIDGLDWALFERVTQSQ